MKVSACVTAGNSAASAFSRSMRALEADGFRRTAGGLLVLALLLGGWLVWFLRAQVALYTVTGNARLELDWAAYPAESPVAGRVVATRLALGREVQAGDVLVELEADTQRLQIEEERTQRRALVPQMRARRDEAAAEEQARRDEEQAAGAAIDEARARHREAEALSQYAEVEAARLEQLHAEGLVGELELLRAKAEAQRRRAATESLQLAIGRLERDQRTRASDRQVRLERLKQEMTRLEGRQATAAVTIERLEREVEKRQIRAPVAGRLGEVADLRVGAYLHEGDRLGTIVSPGPLKIMADFLPSDALGRVRPGQPARLRLYGFPWAQYGSLPAVVTKVAGEVRDGRVRVELAAQPPSASRIPLQHGLPGTVEVEVERVSPAALVLRTAGKLLAAPRAAAESSGRREVAP